MTDQCLDAAFRDKTEAEIKRDGFKKTNPQAAGMRAQARRTQVTRSYPSNGSRAATSQTAGSMTG